MINKFNISEEQKVLFIGSRNSVFVSRTAIFFKGDGIKVKIIDPNEGLSPPFKPILLNRILFQLLKIRNTYRLIQKEDCRSVVMIHFLSIDCVWLVWLLQCRFSRVIGVAYGSDIMRRNKKFDWLFRRSLAHFDCITATNNHVISRILKDFPELEKIEMRVVRFGLSVFDEVDRHISLDVSMADARKILGFENKGYLVSLGYSASEGQRQVELINFFFQKIKKLPDVEFVIPIQYGSSEVKEAVIKRCTEVNAKLSRPVFHPLEEFHSPVKAALMRLATSVLINHSISDAFSGTVQEVIYAGNIVFAESDLPYQNIVGFGCVIRPYNDLNECVLWLSKGRLKRLSKSPLDILKDVRKELRKTSSWESVMPDWHSLIDGSSSNTVVIK